MAGLGRRTHYRKHLTDKVLHDFPTPSTDECIAKVVATRGGNQFDILLAMNDKNSELSTTEERIPQLAILPTKFRKLVWVKRNDFVIVQTGGTDVDATEEGADASEKDSGKKDTGGVRFIINHILYKEQVKHLRSTGLWPTDDHEFSGERIDSKDTSVSATAPCVNEKVVAADGIVYDDYSDEDNDDGDLFVNTNRIANLTLQDSSSESDE